MANNFKVSSLVKSRYAGLGVILLFLKQLSRYFDIVLPVFPEKARYLCQVSLRCIKS
jgi:hypothetical protein